MRKRSLLVPSWYLQLLPLAALEAATAVVEADLAAVPGRSSGKPLCIAAVDVSCMAGRQWLTWSCRYLQPCLGGMLLSSLPLLCCEALSCWRCSWCFRVIVIVCHPGKPAQERAFNQQARLLVCDRRREPCRKVHMWSWQQAHLSLAVVRVAWRCLTLQLEQGQDPVSTEAVHSQHHLWHDLCPSGQSWPLVVGEPPVDQRQGVARKSGAGMMKCPAHGWSAFGLLILAKACQSTAR